MGYQSKTLVGNFNWLCNTFVKCAGGTESVTLGDISVDTDIWSDSNIAILDDGGSVKRYYHEGLTRTVSETYVYWPKASRTTAGVAGWYLYDDGDAEYPMNGKQIPLGQAYCVTCVGGEEGVTITFNGQVYDNTVPYNMVLNFNWLGNCAPTSIKMSEITVDTDLWSDSNIAILDDGGSVKRYYHEGLGRMVSETYVYWPKASRTTAGVAGWYLYDDGDAEYPMNGKEIEAADSFCVTCVGGEEGVTVTLPSAL